MEQLHISDVEDKIQERMEWLEEHLTPQNQIRLDELAKLQGWILCEDEY